MKNILAVIIASFFAFTACEPPAQTFVTSDVGRDNPAACAEVVLSPDSPWGFWGLNADSDLIYFIIRPIADETIKKMIFTIRTTQSFAGPTSFDLIVNGKRKDTGFGEWKDGATIIFFPKTQTPKNAITHFVLKGDFSGLDSGVEVSLELTHIILSSCRAIGLPIQGKVLFLK